MSRKLPSGECENLGRGIEPLMLQPVSILGTLHLGVLREHGYLIGIYRMDGEKIIDAGN